MDRLAKNILLVNDRSSIRDSVKSMLQELGCSVEQAENDRAAINALLQHRDIQIVLTETRLPTMTGLDVLRICRSLCPDMPVILITTIPRDEVVIEALRQGACDYLTWPFSKEHLRPALERIEKLYYNRRQASNTQGLVGGLHLSLAVRSACLSLDKLQHVLQNALGNYTTLPKDDLLNVAMAIEEAVLNGHEHGNLELESGWKEVPLQNGFSSLFEQKKQEHLQRPELSQRELRIELKIDAEKVRISVEDDGHGYEVTDIREEISGKPHGMGLMIISKLMDDVRFNRKGNRITFEKHFSRKATQ